MLTCIRITTRRARLATSLAAAVMAIALAGCATSGDPRLGVIGPDQTTACPVCVHEGDLACAKVRVDDTTPRADFHGHTYYFCSDECRLAFERDPRKYLGR